MSKTITTTITVTTTGDGDNSTESYVFTNTSGVPPTSLVLSTGTNTSLNVPPGAQGVAIICPAGVSVTYKGANADTGVVITAGEFLAHWFASGQASITLLQSSGATQTITLIWL